LKAAPEKYDSSPKLSLLRRRRQLGDFLRENRHAQVACLNTLRDAQLQHLQVLCRIERRPPRLDLKIYPYLPQAAVTTTSARSYLSLLAGGAWS
jgi:hypothetical protein